MEDNEMSKPNYEALLERLKKQDDVINALKKQTEDIIAMNRQLLNTTEPESPRVSKAERHAELEKKLKEGLKHA